MKVIVHKSKTKKVGEGYEKIEFGLEQETLPNIQNAEQLKNTLENKIDEWLDNKSTIVRPKVPEPEPKPVRYCASCGKPTKGYKLCYECHLKSKSD